MGDLAVRARVLAIRRAADPGRLEHPPRRGTRFQPADEAYLIGPYEELLARAPPGPVVPAASRPADGHRTFPG